MEDTHGHANGVLHRPGAGIFLDFLYPADSKALLIRLSKNALNAKRVLKRQERHLSRQFSSQSKEDETASAARSEPLNVDGDMKDTHIINELRRVMQASGERQYDRAWQLFGALDDSYWTASVIADLLDYMSTSTRNTDTKRTIAIFSRLLSKDRSPSSYRVAIAALLQLGNVGRAEGLHERALDEMPPAASVGSEILFVHALQTKHLDLAVRVYHACSKQKVAKEGQESIARLWKNALQLPGLFTNLLEMTVETQSRWAISEAGLSSHRDFVFEFASQAVHHATKADGSKVRRVLRLLHQMKLATAKLYSVAILKITKEEKLASRWAFDPRISLGLYLDWRRHDDFNPSTEVLFEILRSVGFIQSLDGFKANIESVTEDFRRIHGKLTQQAILFLMYTYARLGKTSKVHDLFAEFREQHADQPLWARPLRPLIMVHVRRSEMGKAIEQFERMATEFNVQPDVVCHNMLLHGYSRAGDYEGCLQHLAKMRESGVKPDAFSFGPVLHACGQRGDVDMAKQFLEEAEGQGTTFNTAMLCGLAEAYIGNDNVEEAVAVAEAALKVKQETPEKLTGYLTPLWNHALTAYAGRSNIGSLLRLCRKMKDNGIALDGMSYAAMMLCLANILQTNAAERIMHKVMRRNSVRIVSFHYAILMAGYVAQREYDRVFRLHEQMKARMIPETISTRLPLLKAKALAEVKELKALGVNRHDARLFDAEADLRELVEDVDAITVAESEPRQGLARMPITQSNPDAFFSYIIRLYGERKSFEFVRELFGMYMRKKRETHGSGYGLPLRLLSALMITYRHAKRWTDADECWSLAQQQAAKMVKLVDLTVSSPTVNSDGPSSPSSVAVVTAKESADEGQFGRDPTSLITRPGRISPSYSSVLSSTLVVYLRALADQGRAETITFTVNSLLTAGYTLDTHAWNTYVEALARSGRPLDAFRVCESRLISSWPGWKYSKLPFYYKPRLKPSWLNRLDLKWPWRVRMMPYYRTMVFLARALLLSKKREVLGKADADMNRTPTLRGDGSLKLGEDGTEDEILLDKGNVPLRKFRQVAPRTFMILRTMPRFEDDLQTLYLRSLEEEGA